MIAKISLLLFVISFQNSLIKANESNLEFSFESSFGFLVIFSTFVLKSLRVLFRLLYFDSKSGLSLFEEINRDEIEEEIEEVEILSSF